MSAQHHTPMSPEEAAAKARMLDEFLGKAEPSFPAGKLNASDEGELSFAVASDPQKRAVIIRFAKAVDWIGLDRDSALYLADLLIRRAADLPKTKPTNER